MKTKKFIRHALIPVLAYLITSTVAFSQPPNAFKYQAVLRDASGNIKASTSVNVRIDILQGSTIGTNVYAETFSTQTNAFGLINLEIGNGTIVLGNFSTIDWSTGLYFVKVSVDGTEMGTSQLLSIPYAMYAAKAGNGFSGSYTDLTNKPTTDGSETKVTAGTNITVTGVGTTASPYVINVTPHYISESYGGGIVFYVYDNGQHGLIAATADQSAGIQWYNGTARYTGSTGDGLGGGSMNTAIIVATQISDNQAGNFAAKVCADYSVTVDGITYGDWYLPSIFELNLLYAQKNVVGGFASNSYWSSTETGAGAAWMEDFSNGNQSQNGKAHTQYVRAIRAF